MSDNPELTALQIWILRAQREILLKGSFTRSEAPEPRLSSRLTTQTKPAPVQGPIFCCLAQGWSGATQVETQPVTGGEARRQGIPQAHPETVGPDECQPGIGALDLVE